MAAPPDSAQAHPGSERTPFVGRAAEQARLAHALTRARAGAGGMVLIGGHPGVGKTRLAEEIARSASAAGMRVFSGHSYEAEGGLPYVPYVEILTAAWSAAGSADSFATDVLADGAPEIARLLPGLRRALPELAAPLELPPGQERQYLFRCLSDSIARLAQPSPMMLLLDDFHWADESTLLFTEHLAPQLADLPILVVATYREAEVHGPLARTFAELLRRRVADRVRLGPLEPDEVGTVAELLAGVRPPRAVVESLHALTGGNAFFTEEVVRDLVEGGALFDGDGNINTHVDLTALRVPDGVQLVVGRRVDRLSADTQRILSAAAVAGRVFSVGFLAALEGKAGVDEKVVLAVEEAERAALITEAPGDDEYLFAHEFVRETLRNGLSAPRRRLAHRLAADALIRVHDRRLDERAAEIVLQLELAGEHADQAVLADLCARAGRRALALSAFPEALTYLERAVELGAAAGGERADLYADLGRTRWALGRVEEAVRAWRLSIDAYEAVGDSVATARVCHAMGLALTYGGRAADGIAGFRRGLAALGESACPERVMLLAALTLALGVAGEAAESADCDAQAAALAAELGDEALTGRVDSMRGLAWHAMMQVADSARAGQAAARALRPRGEVGPMVDGLWTAGWSLICMGRYAESEPLFTEFLEIMARVGHPAVGFERRACGPRDFYRTGDLRAFLESLTREIALFEGPHAGGWVAWTYAYYGTALGWLGDWEAAETWLRRGSECAEPSAYDGWCHGAWFLFLAQAGRRDEALAILQRWQERLPRPGEVIGGGFWGLLFDFTEGLCLLGEPALPATWHPLIVEAITRTGTLIAQYAPGQLLERLAAIAAAAGGDYDTAERHFSTALAQAAAFPHVFEGAHTRLWYARMLAARGRSGDRDRARELLTEAADGFARLQMPRLAATARHELVSPWPLPLASTGVTAGLSRRGPVWQVDFCGATVHLSHTKGLSDLAQLLARPGTDVHVLDLATADADGARTAKAEARGADVLDRQALASYRRRLADLDAEQAEAEDHHDGGRLARLDAERDALLAEIRSATGLGGRTRALGGDATERARKAVNNRITREIKRIAAEHPDLGAHLGRSVTTGVTCRYAPTQPITWTVRT